MRNILEDNRLDIVLIGPMDDNSAQISSTAQIAEAVDRLLKTDALSAILNANRTRSFRVHVPENWKDQEIIRGILSRLDIADLVIANITPKGGPKGEPSPNIYYELGLIHALGIPVILICQRDTPIPFYFRANRVVRVNSFEADEISTALTPSLKSLLDPNDDTDFADNRVTQFYDGLPIVDISAAVGLATGYYFNFVGRILKESSFVSLYPDKIKEVIILRPSDIRSTYEQDKEKLINLLAKNNLKLQTEQLKPEENNLKGPIWIDHINGLVIDLPRTIYPLKISPRMLAMEDRFDKSKSQDEDYKKLMVRQKGEELFDKVEQIIRYHIKKERESYRKTHLHFTSFEKLIDKLSEFPASGL